MVFIVSFVCVHVNTWLHFVLIHALPPLLFSTASLSFLLSRFLQILLSCYLFCVILYCFLSACPLKLFILFLSLPVPILPSCPINLCMCIWCVPCIHLCEPKLRSSWEKTFSICLTFDYLLNIMIFSSIHLPGNVMMSFFTRCRTLL